MTETAENNALLEDIERRQDEVLRELDVLNSQIKQVLKQHIAAADETIDPTTAENPVATSGPPAMDSAAVEPAAKPDAAMLRITYVPLPAGENTTFVINDH